MSSTLRLTLTLRPLYVQINIMKHVSKRKNTTSSQKAYIALISIMIIGAIALSIAVSSAILAVGQGRNGLLAQNLTEAKNLANACAEKALMDLKENENYIGNQTVNLNGALCQINPVESPGGTVKIVKVSSQVNQVTKKIKISVSQINPLMTFDSWQEVDNF